MDGSELSEEHLKDYVSAGAELLDRKRPDWFLHIDFGELAMGSTDACILAQVYGSYDEGLRELHMDDSFEATALGFTLFAVGSYDDPDRDQIWVRLGDAWVTQIQYRLDHPAEFRIEE